MTSDGEVVFSGIRIGMQDAKITAMQYDVESDPGLSQIGVGSPSEATVRAGDDTYLQWVPKAKLTATEAIGLIHEACGLAVIAHPGLYHRDEVIAPLVEAGRDGIECFYTRHSTSMTEHYLMLAEKYNLLVTGGSDCHGQNKGRPLIGCVKLPYDFVAKMKSAIVV